MTTPLSPPPTSNGHTHTHARMLAPTRSGEAIVSARGGTAPLGRFGPMLGPNRAELRAVLTPYTRVFVQLLAPITDSRAAGSGRAQSRTAGNKAAGLGQGRT